MMTFSAVALATIKLAISVVWGNLYFINTVSEYSMIDTMLARLNQGVVLQNMAVVEVGESLDVFADNGVEIEVADVAVKSTSSSPVVSGVKIADRLNNEVDLDLKLSGAVLIDVNTGERLLEKDADQQHSIASITKLMSALVFIDNNPGWETEYTVRNSDIRVGNKANIHPGERLTARDVFYDALVASDNIAVIGLVNLTGLTESQFVDQMNIRALSMGLKDTVFNDPTGLANGNVSTAAEVAIFARQAFLHPDIHEAVLTNAHTITVLPDEQRRIYNTDDLLDGDLGDIKILGGKTGYIDKAGYCFVGNFIKGDDEVISVVLGTASRQARFTETAKILDWHYSENSKSQITNPPERLE